MKRRRPEDDDSLVIVNVQGLARTMLANGISIEKIQRGRLTKREVQLIAPYFVKVKNLGVGKPAEVER